MPLILILTLAVVGLISAHARNAGGRTPAQEIKVPDGIVYSVHQYRESEPARAGQMGIAYPENAKSPLPVVVCIHGGGWSKGDKDQMAWMAVRYARRGYVGVTLSYRLTNEAPMPACIIDVKEAIRSLKAMDDSLPIDRERIGVLGYSAGGHLALILGLTPEHPAFKFGSHPEEDSSVNCVVAISAPTDLKERYRRHGKIHFDPNGGSISEDFIRLISPINHVHSKQVPILLMHGDNDPLVPLYHMHNFASASEEIRVTNLEQHEHLGGGHMFFFKQQKQTQPIVDRFLASQLKR